ncbi:N-acetylneuraminate synthase [Crocinitomix catalasitica]|uniref:N-acetylneuraminate synthase n=1 Tax=Crocinitomix catalasitica TaxID=184607 RepID=UPI00055A62D0|nr:N-acetylneuraminate synthase [Crocinitomix catalasitica]
MNINKTVKIGKFVLNESNPVFIIAEAGVNHNGDLKLAKQLIDVAAEAGADAVKFQSFITEELILENVEKADYQKTTTGKLESQFSMLKKLELEVDKMKEVKLYCESKNILFLTTPFDEKSLNLLDELNLDAYKVSSTDTTNIGFIRKVASKGKPIILSTGMCSMTEVEIAVTAAREINPNVILLQCTSNYPVPDNEVNLNVITTFKRKFDMLIGFSDHTPSIGASPYAVVLGAKVVEKHFTLDKNMDGPDHKASLDPKELQMFVKEIRKVEKYLGSFEKTPSQSEIKTKSKLQKSLVAATTILKGMKFDSNNIVAKRTGGNGHSAIELDYILGKTAQKDFKVNELIILE